MVGVWEEVVEADTYDVFFYAHKLTGKCQWDKPWVVANQDSDDMKEFRDLRERGFTKSMIRCALLVQGAWRSKKAREGFKMLIKGKRLMDKAEDKYLNNPRSIIHLCNYMLLVLVRPPHEYDRARPLFNQVC